jgi:hypothetical protein
VPQVLHTLGALGQEPSFEDPMALMARAQRQRQQQGQGQPSKAGPQVERGTITEASNTFPVLPVEQQQQQQLIGSTTHASGWHDIHFQTLDVAGADARLLQQPSQKPSLAAEVSQQLQPQPQPQPQPQLHPPHQQHQQGAPSSLPDFLGSLSLGGPAHQLAAIISAAATAATQAATAMLSQHALPAAASAAAQPLHTPAAGAALQFRPASSYGPSAASPGSLQVEVSQPDAIYRQLELDQMLHEQHQHLEQQQQQHSLRRGRRKSDAVLGLPAAALQQQQGGSAQAAQAAPGACGPPSPEPQQQQLAQPAIPTTASPPPPKTTLPPELAQSVQQTLRIIHGSGPAMSALASDTAAGFAAAAGAAAAAAAPGALPEDVQLHHAALVSVRELLGGPLDYSSLRSELHHLSSAAQMLSSQRSRLAEGAATPRRGAGAQDELQSFAQVGGRGHTHGTGCTARRGCIGSSRQMRKSM